MKKILFVLVAIFAMVSCGGGETSSTKVDNSTSVDSVITDSVSTDTIVTDSITE